jgi:UDPglucose--hexose-1-phosphate uridylyltransferase
MKNSEIRKDYFLDRYVIIAPKRNRRPHKILKKKEDQLTECYFCNPQVNDPAKQIQVKNYYVTHGKWLIKVIGNLYPALSTDNLKAYGAQEIIVETPDHSKEIHELSLEHIHKIFDVYADRYNKLKSLKGIRHVLVFKNEGGKAGASIPHSHSQVIALPIVPPKLEEEAVAFMKYYEDHGSCPYCDIIKSETGSPRVIWEDEHLFVLSPYASDSPYGAWFIPKRHIATLSDLSESEKSSFAHALKLLLGRLDDIDVSYNYFFQNSIENENHHLILKLAPRPNVWAGLELGTGVIINPVPPEEAAKFYQGKLEN